MNLKYILGVVSGVIIVLILTKPEIREILISLLQGLLQ